MAEKKMTMAHYGELELFGPRYQTNKLIASLKAGNDSECILYPIGTFASKDQLRLMDLIGTDKRLRRMTNELGIKHAVPIQRYSWRKIDQSPFPNVFVSAEATGKSFAHLLYAVSKCLASAPISEADEMLNGEPSCHITGEQSTNPEDFINHPKFIIICSSQDKVEQIYRAIDCMKLRAYGEQILDSKRHQLTPIARIIRPDHDDEKLAHRCIESDVLIASPRALIKCIKLNLINFIKCKKIFFDDLDIALQVQNSQIRELIKLYLIQMKTETSSDSSEIKPCRVHIFSSKWTELLKQFLSTIFPQRTDVFCSVAEAAIYANVKFEISTYERDKKNKIEVIANQLKQLLVDCSRMREKVAIICTTDDEAALLTSRLGNRGFKLKLIREADETNDTPKPANAQRGGNCDTVFVISDAALEFEVEFSTRKRPLNDVMHLIHASTPEDMLTFDQRFRLLYKNIQELKSGMTSTLVVNSMSNLKLARQIHDMASRSPVTMQSTKCLLKNLSANRTNQICWRWATSGQCRLLSRNDRFGSYCLDRHTVERPRFGREAPLSNEKDDCWPSSGMVRISITHIISPSEFYFIFEASKRDADACWVKLATSGLDFMKSVQRDLDQLKAAGTRSLPLQKIKRGMLCAVYFPQESRVDRVLILDEPKNENSHSLVNVDLEYCKQISVFKIDYGVCLDVFVKNLIELPDRLAKIPRQCHRGLHLGYKPPDNEPNWLYKSKKHFYDTLCAANQGQEVRAWLRFSREGCFWFEGMAVTRRLSNIDSNDTWTVDPYEELRSLGLAEATSGEPSVLPPSRRLETICRWNHVKLVQASQKAFLRRDVIHQDVYLLVIKSNFDLVVRQSTYNKQLIELEEQLIADCQGGKLTSQEYLAPGVICIANIGGPQLTLNRARIESVLVDEADDIESTNLGVSIIRAIVECLDHGDRLTVPKDCLYQASMSHIRKLPFQAISCKLANLNSGLVAADVDRQKRHTIIDKMYDLTRKDNEMMELKCRLNQDGQIYLYIPDKECRRFVPLYKLLLEETGFELREDLDEVCQEIIKPVDSMFSGLDQRSLFVKNTIIQILREIVEKSLLEEAQRVATSQ